MSLHECPRCEAPCDCAEEDRAFCLHACDDGDADYWDDDDPEEEEA